MLRWVIWPLLAMGIVLMLLGASLLGGWIPNRVWSSSGVGAGLFAGLLSVLLLRKHIRTWRQNNRLRATSVQLSETAEKLTPMLHGEYSPYVIETAEKLAEERDMTAVPVLMIVLQRCVDQQRPGWRDVAEALVNALARIGDRRALDLLYELENVRGIGIIPSIRNAIASIEPQTSLLRPGSADDALTETLLRPAHGSSRPEADPMLLLRPTKAD